MVQQHGGVAADRRAVSGGQPLQVETFVDLADARAQAQTWCATTAGLRVHGTTAARPAQHFALVEAPCLLPAPAWLYDLPIYARPKVHRDHHLEVAKALYSVPGSVPGSTWFAGWLARIRCPGSKGLAAEQSGM